MCLSRNTDSPCFYSRQLSSVGETVSTSASDLYSWLTEVKPDMVLCLCSQGSMCWEAFLLRVGLTILLFINKTFPSVKLPLSECFCFMQSPEETYKHALVYDHTPPILLFDINSNWTSWPVSACFYCTALLHLNVSTKIVPPQWLWLNNDTTWHGL